MEKKKKKSKQTNQKNPHNNPMAEQAFDHHNLKKIKLKRCSVNHMKNIPCCVLLLTSTMCLLTYMYHPLLQMIKKKHGDEYKNKCTDVQKMFGLYGPVVINTD